MAEPKVRFKRDDGSSYPAWKEYSISDLFTKIGNKNKDGQYTNVITNSAKFGLIPQRDYFDKDIAVEGNTGNYTIIQTGDFVYNPRKSSYAPMGPFNCYRLDEDGIVSPLYSCLRPKGVLNPEYLLWYFKTDKWYGYVNDHGAQNGARHDRVGMTDKILMGIPVTAPCEEEQQKIADFLSSVDDVISTSEQEVANLETQKKAVMKKIFSQEVRFKKADGTDFPEWEELRIDEAAVINPRTPPIPDEFYYMDLGSVDHGQWLDKNIVVRDDAPSRAQRVADMGDVFFQSVRPYNMGHYCLDTLLDKTVVASTGFLQLRCNNMLLNRFLFQLLFEENFNKEVDLRCTGQAYPSINTESFSEIMIGIPCLEEQHLIADFLSDFDEAIAAAKKELELWKELKKGLLQQMFV